MVVPGIQAGRAAQRSGLSLDGLGIVFPFFRHFRFRLGRRVFLIRRVFHDRNQRDSADHHRLIDSLQGQGVFPFIEMKSVGFGLVSHIIPEESGLPVKNLFLAGADIIPLVILPYFTHIRPKAAERQRARARKRQLAVDQELAFNIDAAAFGRQVLQPDIVHAGLRHIRLPGDRRSVFGHNAFCLFFSVSFKGEHVNRDLLSRFRFGSIGGRVGFIRIAAADPGNIRGKVCSGILFAVVVISLVQQGDQHDKNSNRKNPDENVPPFS